MKKLYLGLLLVGCQLYSSEQVKLIQGRYSEVNEQYLAHKSAFTKAGQVMVLGATYFVVGALGRNTVRRVLNLSALKNYPLTARILDTGIGGIGGIGGVAVAANEYHKKFKVVDKQNGIYEVTLPTTEEQNKNAMLWGTTGIAGCTALATIGASALVPKANARQLMGVSAAGCTAMYGALVASLENVKSKKE